MESTYTLYVAGRLIRHSTDFNELYDVGMDLLTVCIDGIFAGIWDPKAGQNGAYIWEARKLNGEVTELER